jgi:multicomponent K+:H+ antiporter subunit D
LPATYAASSAPVAALFAIMTKVGVYAIWRVHGVIFGSSAGASALLVEPLLLPLALATAALGVMGVLAAQTLPRLVAWLTVASVGTILIAVGLFGEAAWSTALYYMAHSTLTVAGLFLLVELVAAQRGEVGGRIESASPVAQPTMLGLMLLLAAASSVGLPPMPGFIGKLMLLQASIGHGHATLVWSVVLLAGFATLIGLARAGSTLFWHVRTDLPSGASGASAPLIAATSMLLVASVAMSVFAGPLQRYTQAAAAQLADRKAYADAVLGEQGGTGARTARPYTGDGGVGR